MYGRSENSEVKVTIVFPCVSDHYSRSTYAPFSRKPASSKHLFLSLAGVTGAGRIKGLGVGRLWVIIVVIWGIVSLGHCC